jgi:hypothetical protein
MARRQRLTPEQAARKPGYLGRFLAWLGFGPEAEEGAPPEREAAPPEREPAPPEKAKRPTQTAEQIAAAEADAERIRVTAEAPPAAADKEAVSLSTAGLDDLLGLGMSATQAKRVLDYRERMDGFDSLDDLDRLPGFPMAFLSEIKQRLTL